MKSTEYEKRFDKSENITEKLTGLKAGLSLATPREDLNPDKYYFENKQNY